MSKQRTGKGPSRAKTERSRKKIHYTQNMKIEAVPLDDDTLRVDGTLKDPDHHIKVYIVVAIKAREVLDAGARMLRQPYPTCNQAMRRAHDIVGLKIEAGLYQKLATIVGGPQGCVHLVDILMASCKMAANAIIGIVVGKKTWDDITDRDDEFHDRLMSANEGMCIGFNKDAIARSRSK
jgi:hypothetical protein